MAQKYVVKKEDNPLKLAAKFETSPQAILQNNAIKSLTAGQTIKVPTNFSNERGWDQTPVNTNVLSARERYIQAGAANQNSPFPVSTNPLFVSPPTTQAQGSFVSGSGQVNTVSTNPRFVSPPTTQAQGSFVSGSGQVNTAQVPMNGSVPSNVTNGGYLSPNGTYNSTSQTSNVHTQVPIYGQITSAQLQQQIAQQNAAQTPATPPRPTGVYTGDPKDPNTAQWRNYWNWQAKNPSLVPQAAPIVMTRDQVWNMKAEQRRREDDGTSQEFVSYQPYLQPIQPTYEPFFGNNIVQGSFRG